MSKYGFYSIVFLALFLLGFFLIRWEQKAPDVQRRTRVAMGTVVEVQVRGLDEVRAEQALSAALAEIERIDSLLSPEGAQSEVWRVNQQQGRVVEVSVELYSLLEASDAFWRLSDGAFDAGLGALVDVWGFGGASPAVPSEHDLLTALEVSGWGQVRLEGDQRALIRSPGLKLNLGGIGKGYAVDRAVEVLRQEGVTQGLVNAGGEIRSLGDGWLVGVQHPRQANRLLKTARLDEMAVATSGDYEQYFSENGRRYHHILDPHTGLPAQGVQSATVVAKTCLEADVLSTALFVLGIEEGLRLAEQLPEVEAMMVNGDGVIFMTSGFEQYLTGQ